MESTTQEKWDKFVSGLQWVLSEAEGNSKIETVGLRRVAGLGINLTEIYVELRCYLRLVFNAMESWRDDRDEDGWRRADAEDRAALWEAVGDLGEEVGEMIQEDYPDVVDITAELILGAETLLSFFCTPEPRIRLVRPKHKEDLLYVCGDASGHAFGAGTQDAMGEVEVQEGLWTMDDSARGSNWREARNLANQLLRDLRAGKMDGKEAWVASDNFTFMSAMNKGLTTSRQLFEIVREVKQESLARQCFLHCFHISGVRMILAGFDGVSRGDFDTGVLLGQDMRNFLPLDVGAFDTVGNGLWSWLSSWMGDDFKGPLTPEGWFTTGHKPGIHVWAPPPAAALDALEQLADSQFKQPYQVTHVVLIPCLLFEEEWRRWFGKEMDFWFLMLTGEFWPHSCCERLVVGISFPMHREPPWLVRRTGAMVGLGWRLQEMSRTGNLGLQGDLCKLWSDPWGIL